ncbi:MAG: ABC transporter permease [Anaerolineae bacterium]
MSDTQTTPARSSATPRLTYGGEIRERPRFPALRSLYRRKLALLAAIVVITVILVAIFAPVLTSYDPTKIDIINRLKPPGYRDSDGSLHILGTDTLGRDVFSRLVYGSRVSLVVGLSAVLVAGTLGVFLGLVAGYFGGFIDDIIMRIGDIQLAFPFILLAISILAVLGPGVDKLIIVLGISGWVTYGRLARSQVIYLREMEFVHAAKAIGAKQGRIMSRHVLPNLWGVVIVIASFAVASTIIAEASLSFLGLGVPPEVPTWGGMLSDSREYLEITPWLVIFPGLAISLTVLSINVLGDWIRDFLDPRMKNIV